MTFLVYTGDDLLSIRRGERQVAGHVPVRKFGVSVVLESEGNNHEVHEAPFGLHDVTFGMTPVFLTGEARQRMGAARGTRAGSIRNPLSRCFRYSGFATLAAGGTLLLSTLLLESRFS